MDQAKEKEDKTARWVDFLKLRKEELNRLRDSCQTEGLSELLHVALQENQPLETLFAAWRNLENLTNLQQRLKNALEDTTKQNQPAQMISSFASLLEDAIILRSTYEPFCYALRKQSIEYELRDIIALDDIRSALEKWESRAANAAMLGNDSLATQFRARVEVLEGKLAKL